MARRNAKVRYFLDEGLPPQVAQGLSGLRVSIETVRLGSLDNAIISRVTEHGPLGVWVTRDWNARQVHRQSISKAGISVAWIRDRNGSSLKQAFMVMSFIYRFGRMIQETDSPLYFEVTERVANGTPRAVVRTATDLEAIAG